MKEASRYGLFRPVGASAAGACLLLAVLLFAFPVLAGGNLAIAAEAQPGESAAESEDMAAEEPSALSEAINAVARKEILDISRQVDDTVIVAKAINQVKAVGSATDYAIAVDIPANRTVVLRRSGEGWIVEKYWVCSTGAPEMPTVLGVYEVNDRGYSFGEGYTCYYYTQFYENYLFHSVKYVEGTFDVLDGRLGEPVSEGCVRLDIDNAKWIYDTIPWGTRVVVYE